MNAWFTENCKIEKVAMHFRPLLNYKQAYVTIAGLHIHTNNRPTSVNRIMLSWPSSYSFYGYRTRKDCRQIELATNTNLGRPYVFRISLSVSKTIRSSLRRLKVDDFHRRRRTCWASETAQSEAFTACLNSIESASH